MKKFEMNGVIKEVPEGFSWTTFLFGGFVPMFRGDIKWALIGIASFIMGMFTMGISALVFNIFMCFKYNELHMNDLKEKGYKELKPVYRTEG